ncbi:hypothetical protein FS837_010635 [Tulasnella sp. UAMH 9824]|nr:hypothetical protein FS837_010635 [Tulasnella sp. UAMH 9824]
MQPIRPAPYPPTASSSSKSFPHEYPPITPPHLTHSRRGSRESGETSSTNSTPSTGGSGATGSSLVHRHKRGHASASMSPQSPIAIRKARKSKKKDAVEDEDEEDQPMSDEEDPTVSQKLRREDAKKSRQDAEQKRRDQLKSAYEHLRTVVPGTNEKTSKVLLVTQARGWIEKLTNERRELRVKFDEAVLDRKALQDLNERLMKRLDAHGIDFQEDLNAANMRLEGDTSQPGDASGPPAALQPAPVLSNPAPQATHGPQIQPRPGHIRTSSHVTSSQFPPGSGIPPVPMSAPSHTTALPANYPPMPISTPTSPLKGTTTMVPPPLPVVPSQGHMNGVPHLNVAIPGGVHPLPSPSSSASSFAPRQSLYSLEGQTMFSSEDHSSGASYPPSATSSNVNVNVSHLAIDEWHPQRSQPHSPSQGLATFSNSGFHDPSSFHPGDMPFAGAGAGFGDPNLGLQGHPQGAINGVHGNVGSSHGGYPLGHDGGDPAIMPRIPGAFPQDDYGHHSLGVPPQSFMAPGYDASSMGMGYAAPQMTFTQPGGLPADQSQFLAHSPLGSQAPSPSHQQSQFLTTATPHLGPGGQHLSVVPSPSHGDQTFQVHSPLPPSPAGPYPDGSQSVRIETGISPKMLVGAPDSLGPSQQETTVAQ